MTPPTFQPVRAARISDSVVAQVRDAILRGELRPGDRLPSERDLAAQFGVSRVAVRDALRTLEAGGLVRVRAGRGGGPSVAAPDVEQLSGALGNHLMLIGTDLSELAEARLALETTAARLACVRATEADLDALRAAVDVPAGGDSARASVDFHTALVSAAHNRALRALFDALRVLMQEAIDLMHERLPDTAEVARAVHAEICDAVAARDPERAVATIREHLDDFGARLERIRAGNGSLPTVPSA